MNRQSSRAARQWGRVRAFFSKPANVILVVFCVVLCLLTLYPLLLLMLETVTVHAGKEMRAVSQAEGTFTL